MISCLGCATGPRQRTTTTLTTKQGIYHTIAKGETLWRISKYYSVDLDELIRVNKISDVTNIEIGTRLLIPVSAPDPKQRIPITVNSNDDFIWPLKGKVISSFGQNYIDTINKGLNIQPLHSNDVIASRSGTVVFCDEKFDSYGKTVIIDHGDGFLTIYARNSELLVKVGETIEQGRLIAKTGSSGRDPTVYLHFEIRKGSVPKNPYFYLPS